MKIFTYIIYFCIVSFSPIQAKNNSSCDKNQEVCVISQKKLSNSYHFTAINNTPHIVSIYIDIDSENMQSNKSFPIKLVLKAKSKLKVAHLRIIKTNQKSGFKISYSWMHGSYIATSNNFSYKFPYKLNTSHKVGQGFNTKKTHQGLDKYAIDWNMTIGTPIHAARSGYVIDFKQDSNTGGKTKKFMDKANYIKILHRDGSIGVYAHLKYNGVMVKKGKYISQGSLIGYSGNTGFSTGPHLHFHVAKPAIRNGKIVELTMPVKFSNCKTPKSFTPQEGKKYISC